MAQKRTVGSPAAGQGEPAIVSLGHAAGDKDRWIPTGRTQAHDEVRERQHGQGSEMISKLDKNPRSVALVRRNQSMSRMRGVGFATIGTMLLAWAFVGSATGAGMDSEADLLDAARRYVETPAQQSALDMMTSAESLQAQLEALMPGSAGPALEQIAQGMADAMAENRESLEEAFVAAAARHFTVAEMDALTAFYETEEGAEISRKMQPFMADLSRSLAESASGAAMRNILGGRSQ